MRVHHKPRRALFSPTGTKDGPCIEELCGKRSTRINFCDSSKSEVIHDMWISEDPHRCMTKRWTGITVFLLSPADEVDPSEQVSFNRGDETISSRAGELVVNLISSREDTGTKNTRVPKRDYETKLSEKQIGQISSKIAGQLGCGFVRLEV